MFAVDRDLGSGYVQQWNTSLQRELTSDISVEVAYVGSKITRVGLPDTNLNQLTVEQLAQGSPLLQFGCPIRSSAPGPAVVVASATRRSLRAQLLRAVYRRYHDGEPVSEQRRARRSTRASYAKLEQRFSGGLSYLVSYTRSKLDGRRLVGVRRVDSHRAGRQLPGRRQRSTARLERDYSTGDIPHVFVASAVWDVPFGRGHRRRGVAGGLGALVNDWTLTGAAHRCSRASRSPSPKPTNSNSVRGVRHAAAQPDRRSGPACRRAVRQQVVRHQRVFNGLSVHAWHEPAQPGAGTGLSQSRHRRRATGAAAGEPPRSKPEWRCST